MDKNVYLFSLDGRVQYSVLLSGDGGKVTQRGFVPWHPQPATFPVLDFALDDKIELLPDGSLSTHLYVIQNGIYKKHAPVEIYYFEGLPKINFLKLQKEMRDYLAKIHTGYISYKALEDARLMGACVARGIPSENFFEQKPPESLAEKFGKVACRRVPHIDPISHRVRYIHFLENYPVAVTEMQNGREVNYMPNERILQGFLKPDNWFTMSRLCAGGHGHPAFCEIVMNEGGRPVTIRIRPAFLYNDKGNVHLVNTEREELIKLGFDVSSNGIYSKSYTPRESAEIFKRLSSEKDPVEKNQGSDFWTEGVSYQQRPLVYSMQKIRYIKA